MFEVAGTCGCYFCLNVTYRKVLDFFFPLSSDCRRVLTGNVWTQFLREGTSPHKPKKMKEIIFDVKYTLWDVLIAALNVNLKAAYPPDLFKSDKSIFVFIFFMGALFRTHINLLVFVPFAQAGTTVNTWSHGFSLTWDFVHLVVNINVFWKKDQRGSVRAAERALEGLVSRGVNRGREWSLGHRWSDGVEEAIPGGKSHTNLCVFVCGRNLPAVLYTQKYTEQPSYIWLFWPSVMCDNLFVILIKLLCQWFN